MQRKPLYIATAFALASLSATTSNVFADAATALEEMTIIGNADAVKNLAGSAHVIGQEELEKFEFTDIHQVLRQVPGINIREGDGYGLRPNIGIRGTGSERSSRITLMEDGVLIAPAPYAAPAAYYFPTTGRIAGVEVLKGPAAIKSGPYTVGGAVNLLSTPIPEQDGGKLKFEAGSDSTFRAHFNYGQNGDNFDWVIETHQWQSDGFSDIDFSNNDTGFDKEDYLAKFRLHSDVNSEVYQQLELKIQKSDEESEQTYVGLTDADFRRDATRRYAASQLDVMHADNKLITLQYFVDFNDVFTFSATAYRNEVARNWFKTDRIDGRSYTSIINALNNGTGTAADQALLDGTTVGPVDVRLKDNNREYLSQGIDLKFGYNVEIGNSQHELSAGIRYHDDEEDRFQRTGNYLLENGQLTLDDPGTWGNAGNRVVDAEAIAIYIHDQITLGDLTLTPGIRYETIDFRRRDWSDADRQTLSGSSPRTNETREVLPGIGATYQVNEELQLIAGIHKGFTPAGFTDTADNEESTNYEFGLRFENDKVSAELIGFYNDYENLLGSCTASTGSDCDPGDQFNGEGVSVKGVEALFSYSLASGHNYDVPVQLTYTYTDAEFESSFDSDFFGDVEAGDKLTYTPDHQAFMTVGYVNNAGWDLFLSAKYIDELCTTASCGAFEQTDSSLVFGLAGHYQLNEAVKLYATVDNLTDEADIVARAPYGARVNKPRSFTLGVNYSF